MPYYTPTENANLIKKLEDSDNEIAALRMQLAEARKVIEPIAREAYRWNILGAEKYTEDESLLTVAEMTRALKWLEDNAT
jgi:hypothetical protein